jgi:hypothetical protein
MSPLILSHTVGTHCICYPFKLISNHRQLECVSSYAGVHGLIVRNSLGLTAGFMPLNLPPNYNHFLWLGPFSIQILFIHRQLLCHDVKPIYVVPPSSFMCDTWMSCPPPFPGGGGDIRQATILPRVSGEVHRRGVEDVARRFHMAVA